MARKKDIDWNCGNENDTTIPQAHLAVLMDIRDELKALNRLLNYSNFIDIPNRLRRIRDAVERTDRRLTKRIPLRKGKTK